MNQKQYLLIHNQSEAQRKAVSKANSTRVWSDSSRKKLSDSMRESHKKRKEKNRYGLKTFTTQLLFIYDNWYI